MLVSAGSLDDLVGFTFSTSQFPAVTIASYAQNANGSLVDILTQVLGSHSALEGPGGPFVYSVTSVVDSANRIAINQFKPVPGGAAFVQTLVYNVIGYNSASMLISALTTSDLIAALQSKRAITGLIGVISTGAFPSGTNLNFAPNAIFTGAPPACFALGTRILTDAGEVAVEQVRVGDLVPGQVSGKLRTVRWVGRRTVQVARHPQPWDVAPVRIRAGALAAGRPHRDLFLSPDHAVFVGGALIPVRYLINGATIRQEPVEAVTYLHVELDGHDVLLAEGLPCESYLDTGNRSLFAVATPAEPVVPPPWPPLPASPLHCNSPALGARPHG